MLSPARLRCRGAYCGIAIHAPVQAGIVGADVLARRALALAALPGVFPLAGYTPQLVHKLIVDAFAGRDAEFAHAHGLRAALDLKPVLLRGLGHP